MAHVIPNIHFIVIYICAYACHRSKVSLMTHLVNISAVLPVKKNFPNTLEGYMCYCTCSGGQQERIQGRRKQFFSGQANQLQSCVYAEFKVMSGHKCKLLCEAH